MSADIPGNQQTNLSAIDLNLPSKRLFNMSFPETQPIPEKHLRQYRHGTQATRACQYKNGNGRDCREFAAPGRVVA